MDAIDNLLERAELCFERGQYKMVSAYLDEIESRAKAVELSDEQDYQFNSLAERMHEQGFDAEDEGEDNTPKANDVCTKCGGSKFYTYANGSRGTCYDCQGKGYQTEKDIVRVKNYWAYRRAEVQKRKEAAAQLQTAWPF